MANDDKKESNYLQWIINGENDGVEINACSAYIPNNMITGWITVDQETGTVIEISDTPIEEKKPVKIQQLKVKIGSEEGYKCTTCNDFSPYAEVDEETGVYQCYACKKGIR